MTDYTDMTKHESPRSNSPQVLPGQRPKDERDDQNSPGRIAEILTNPGYRVADHDADFLQSADTRGVRLQLDYLKPELGLRSHGIGHTIVVFGSSRIEEPRAAERGLSEARLALSAHPESEDLRRAVRIAERIADNSRYYEVARAFTRLVGRAAERSHGDRVAVMTGGGPGLMEAANRGAQEVGARSVGLNISLPHEQYPNPYLTPELCFQFHYFAIRKLHFLNRARALVAFPGGYGTFDELFETLTLIQTRKIARLPVVLVGRQFWSRAVDFDFLVGEGVIAPEDAQLFKVVETAVEIHEHISSWYREQGRPLLD